jgi:hypothetical protein
MTDGKLGYCTRVIWKVTSGELLNKTSNEKKNLLYTKIYTLLRYFSA